MEDQQELEMQQNERMLRIITSAFHLIQYAQTGGRPEDVQAALQDLINTFHKTYESAEVVVADISRFADRLGINARVRAVPVKPGTDIVH